METQKEIIQFPSGLQLTIHENDWSMARQRSRLEESVPELTPESSTFDYFRKKFYPLLVAVAEGEKIPTPEEAYGIPNGGLDLWYLSVWRLNPDWFADPFEKEACMQGVTFRDGTEITVTETKGLPSYMMVLHNLEHDAIVNPSDDAEYQMFRMVFYPKMAACVVGTAPACHEVYRWPSSEVDKWYIAARQVNPSWFGPLDELQAMAEAAENEKKAVKKKERKRAGSSRVSRRS